MPLVPLFGITVVLQSPRRTSFQPGMNHAGDVHAPKDISDRIHCKSPLQISPLGQLAKRSGLNDKSRLPFQSSLALDDPADGERQMNSIPLQYGEVEL
jgi:hypothetical protein